MVGDDFSSEICEEKKSVSAEATVLGRQVKFDRSGCQRTLRHGWAARFFYGSSKLLCLVAKI